MHIRPKAQAMPSKHFPARDGAASSAPKIESREPASVREPNCGDRLLTPREAADFLRVSKSWLAKARMRGDGPPYVKVGRSIRYRRGRSGCSGSNLACICRPASGSQQTSCWRREAKSEMRSEYRLSEDLRIELGIMVHRNTSLYIIRN